MKELTKEKINVFNISELGYDMMGYTFDEESELSFHHLLIPKRKCKFLGWGNGYYMWNGAILVRNTSHDYLHLIEELDKNTFYAITSEMIDENLLREIRIEHLKRIRELLLLFEDKYKDELKRKEPLIKPEYIEKRISLR